MNVGIIFTLSSFFYMVLLCVAFFTKKRIEKKENRVYSYLIITSFSGVIIGLLCWYFMQNMNKYMLLNIIFSKLYLVYLITWLTFFSLYIVLITFPKVDYSKWKRSFVLGYLLIYSVVFLLPLDYVSEGNVVYSYGSAANFIYLLSGVLIIILGYCMIKNRKVIFQRKFYPLILFMLLGGVVMTIQKINPQLHLLTFAESFITFLMYFTIENPDVSMLNELYKNKELMEQNYEDKYNFLFEMTQEARNPLVSINSVCSELSKEELPENVKDKVNNLSHLIRQLDFSINNVLNISSLDVQKIKIINNKYNLEKVCNDLVTRIKPEVKDSVKLQVDLPKQIPTLYGDYLKLRQILYSILINACKNTTQGSINLKVNLIEKYDICRLIINISDTGSGMSIEKVNEIISSTGELNKQELENLEMKEFNVKVCQKVIKIMGGNLMIKSNVGEGTDVILTLDQRVYHEKENTILNQYENDISNYKKVLIVSQDKHLISTIKNKLSLNHITASSFYYGMDAVDKIKSGKKYDFILIEDEMQEMSGFMTFKNMKEVKGFDIPTIIMLREDKEHISKQFIEDGFTDYLVIENIDSELEKIIEKY